MYTWSLTHTHNKLGTRLCSLQVLEEIRPSREVVDSDNETLNAMTPQPVLT